MISRDKYSEAKSLHAEIQQELQFGQLTDDQRSRLEHNASELAGVLLSPWFPVDWGRRLTMLAIFILGAQQAIVGNYQPMLYWLLLPIFSPRIVGEAALLFGRLKRLSKFR